jgi:HEAT repeat protein
MMKSFTLKVMTKNTRCLLMSFFCLWGLSVGVVWADDTTDSVIAQAQKAYEEEKFQEAVDVLKPILKKPPVPLGATRLHLLALARLGEIPDALDAYEAMVKSSKREDEGLLRQMVIASILPRRTDMREQIRGAAYTALKEIGSDEVIPYLEDGLTDGSGMLRALVAEALAKRKAGQQSKRFRNALKDEAGLVRAAVLIGLGRTGEAGLTSLVVKSLQDEQALVQIAAARALYELGHKKYWTRIEQGAQSQEGYERGAAIRAFGELGDKRAIPILEKTATDAQPSIRAAALISLGKLTLPETLPTLKAAVFDPIPAVRSVAALSLGYFAPHEVLATLRRALADTNPGVRAASVASLLRVGAPFSVVEGAVHQLLQDSNPAIRSGIAKALGNGKGSKVIGTLMIILNDPLPRPRIVAVRSLGRIQERTLLPVLKRTLRDSDAAVRVTAAAAIVRLLDAKIGT